MKQLGRFVEHIINFGGKDSPPLDDGDDIINLNVKFVRLIKVLQSTHVCGHGLKNKKV